MEIFNAYTILYYISRCFNGSANETAPVKGRRLYACSTYIYFYLHRDMSEPLLKQCKLAGAVVAYNY